MNERADLQLIVTRIRKLDINNPFITIDWEETENKFDVESKIECIDTESNPEKDVCEVSMLLNVDVLSKNNSNFTLVLDLVGLFEVNKRIEKERLEEMLEINGGAALYSIARSIITSITALSYVGTPVLLPMINMLAVRENKRKQKSKKDNAEK